MWSFVEGPALVANPHRHATRAAERWPYEPQSGWKRFVGSRTRLYARGPSTFEDGRTRLFNLQSDSVIEAPTDGPIVLSVWRAGFRTGAGHLPDVRASEVFAQDADAAEEPQQLCRGVVRAGWDHFSRSTSESGRLWVRWIRQVSEHLEVCVRRFQPRAVPARAGGDGDIGRGNRHTSRASALSQIVGHRPDLIVRRQDRKDRCKTA